MRFKGFAYIYWYPSPALVGNIRVQQKLVKWWDQLVLIGGLGYLRSEMCRRILAVMEVDLYEALS